MNINSVFPSNYVKADELDGDTVVTIKDVTIESLGQGTDAEDKPIVYFEEFDKGLVLNKTNANVIAQLYGPETDGWPGNRITIYATEVEFAGRMTLGIRVRLRKPAGKSLPAAGTDEAGKARRAVFAAYKGQNGTLSEDEQKTGFKALFQKVLGDKADMKTATAEDWNKVDEAMSTGVSADDDMPWD